MNSVKEYNIKSRTYYFSYDRINIKNHDSKNIKINKKSYTNIPIYYIGYLTPNSVKPL